jgi:hypothetical protein
MRHETERRVRDTFTAKVFVASVCLVILSLSVALATRTFRCTFSSGTSVQSGTAQAIRQHLDRDALQWTPPVVDFSVLEAPAFYPRLAPAGPPVAAALFHKNLYNRPPPSC